MARHGFKANRAGDGLAFVAGALRVVQRERAVMRAQLRAIADARRLLAVARPLQAAGCVAARPYHASAEHAAQVKAQGGLDMRTPAARIAHGCGSICAGSSSATSARMAA